MYHVKFQKYYNDLNYSYEEKDFSSLKILEDWMFDLVDGKYKDKMWFTNPDNQKCYPDNEKLKLDNSCIKVRTNFATYGIELIKKDKVIIYSTGKFTNGICHWNEDIKNWLRECRNRMMNPTFNFG